MVFFFFFTLKYVFKSFSDSIDLDDPDPNTINTDPNHWHGIFTKEKDDLGVKIEITFYIGDISELILISLYLLLILFTLGT